LPLDPTLVAHRSRRRGQQSDRRRQPVEPLGALRERRTAASDEAKATPLPPKNLTPPKAAAILVLGKKVRGPAREVIRRVVDLLLDRHAHLRAVVIDFGGFLGVISRKIAIDWWLIRFMPDDPDIPLVLSLGTTEIQATLEYSDTGPPPIMVGLPRSDPDGAG